MNPAFVDVAVLILFFNRPEPLAQVFEQVKKARPSRLFLYQDGPRGEEDIPGIEACREIVSQIDWECDVHKNYQKRNYGCDPSGYLSQKWAFSLADKCIVLEDDVVPSVSFFSFCKDLLDLYENDDRITMIAGFNYEEISPRITSDYFFSSTFSIWGWASWKRVVDKWDENYSFLDEPTTMYQLEGLIKERKFRSDIIPMCLSHRRRGKAYFESIFWSSMLLNSGLAIVPTHNLINNIGATNDSTHFASSIETMPKGYRRIFTMKRYELEFPLEHPKYIIENVAYKLSVYKIMAWGHPWIKISRSFEELYLNLKARNFTVIKTAIKNRIFKWLGRNQFK
ncbi:MAG: hemolysin activation protein [Prevotella sp.]|nr:hemolysin activation protein [Prevotella sp.]